MNNYWSDLNIKVTYRKIWYIVGTVMCDIFDNYCTEAVNFISLYVQNLFYCMFDIVESRIWTPKIGPVKRYDSVLQSAIPSLRGLKKCARDSVWPRYASPLHWYKENLRGLMKHGLALVSTCGTDGVWP